MEIKTGTLKTGDIVINDETGSVARVIGFTIGDSPIIPAGWPVDQNGATLNPHFIRHYRGAKSVLPGDINPECWETSIK